MSLEKRSIDLDVFQRDDARLALDLDDPVDQQERIAMRQDAHDLADLEHLPSFQNAVGVFHCRAAPIINGQRCGMRLPASSSAFCFFLPASRFPLPASCFLLPAKAAPAVPAPAPPA